MLKIKLTSKRQATFPVRVCESLGVGPGDEIFLDSSTGEDGSTVWLLRPDKPRPRPWLGSLRAYAKGKDHSMDSVRRSIASARRKAKNV